MHRYPLSVPDSMEMPKSDRSDCNLPTAPDDQEPRVQTPPPERERLQCRVENGEETSDVSDE